MSDRMRLEDREAIRDCLYRYCRGIDRADEAALLSSYWPDATDCHGATSGPVLEFFDRVRASWARNPRNVHQISNILIEFRGPAQAAVESSFLALQQGAGPDGVLRRVMLAGRYCDLFEQRGGDWRVLRRTVVYDWVQPETPFTEGEAARFGLRRPIGREFPDDPVYHIG
ncbi:MAG: nuclear transport factor 2 family protein [Rhodobacter sp.]|nr:nuclear transport factor 2 family protein [Paracoccaceae bacterium]MCC0076573.1 nuclear transport factor 2 family protein [Rhodobacter sp.]